VNLWWAREAKQPVRRRNAYFLLRSILSAAVEEELNQKNPRAIKDAGRDVAAKRPDWTIADFDAVRAHVDEELRPALQMLLAGYLRLGELLGLNASDYDPATGRITVTKQRNGEPTKTGQHKRIPIMQRGREAMADYLAASPRIGAAPLFTG